MNRIHIDILNDKWGQGCGTPTCSKAKNIVLGRGPYPCDVLFVGEAPGRTEDDGGDPFIGPAGIFLEEEIIAPAERDARVILSKGFTNMVACIPLEEDGNKRFEPTNACIQACTPRLLDVIRLFRPRLIIEVGKIAEKKLKKAMDTEKDTRYWHEHCQFVSIMHPSAILQAHDAQQPLFIHKAVVTLTQAFIDLGDKLKKH